MKKIYISSLFCMMLTGSLAQTPKSTAPSSASPILYGPSVTLLQAGKIMDAALQEAAKNGWTMAIAIVDTGGNLVSFQRMDNTQVGSVEVALGKAKTANNFKRSTKVFEDAITNGGTGLRVLSIPGVVPLEGGEPIMLQGKVIGGIGVSGMQSTQDEQVAKAGLSALN